MEIHGYDANGPKAYGSEYARAHPNDLPDEAIPNLGKKLRFGYRLVEIGALDTVLGVPVCFVGGKDNDGLVLDTRAVSGDKLAKVMPPGRLFLWRGMYWLVFSVHGVFVTISMWGTKRRKEGWVIRSIQGVEIATKVPR